jgi:hypothetical protein
VLQPSPLKEISSRDLRKERGSKEGRNKFDECLHGKIDDEDKWEDVGDSIVGHGHLAR